MPVPFIDLSRLTNRIRTDVLAAWTEVFDAREFVGGPRVGTLEKELSSALGVSLTVTCANGTDALLLALQAMGVKHGMKVALPDLTFWATFEAVANLGAVPVLVDIDPTDLQLDADALRDAHAKHKLDAVMLVHLYGWCSARLTEIRAFCQEKHIALIEDGAQCFGVEVNGKPVLADSEIGTTSFYPAKVIGGAMDGGAITLDNNADREALVRSLCNHGRATHYSYDHVGWNSRMGGVQAAFLSRLLKELPAILESRRHAAERYRFKLAGIPGITVFGPPKGVAENGYLNVVTIDSRPVNDVMEKLKAAGIGAGRVYPETLSSQKPASAAILHGDRPHAKRIAGSVLSLPLFFGITDAEIDESAAALKNAVG